jgi:hypothetical protein
VKDCAPKKTPDLTFQSLILTVHTLFPKRGALVIMKATSLFLLPAAVSAAVLNTRQFGINSMGGAKVEKITKLTPEIRPDAIRQITRFGPYKLKGVSSTFFRFRDNDRKGHTNSSSLL